MWGIGTHTQTIKWLYELGEKILYHGFVRISFFQGLSCGSAVGNVIWFGWWVSFSPPPPALFLLFPARNLKLSQIHVQSTGIRPRDSVPFQWNVPGLGTDICGCDLPVNPPASLLLFFCISYNIQGKDSRIAFTGLCYL